MKEILPSVKEFLNYEKILTKISIQCKDMDNDQKIKYEFLINIIKTTKVNNILIFQKKKIIILK